MSEQSYAHARPLSATAVSDLNSNTLQRTMPLFQSYKLLQVYAVITTANVAACTVTLNREITPSATTSQIAIGTWIIPIQATLGTVYVADLWPIADTDLAIGETLSFTPAASGSAGGAWFGVLAAPYLEGPIANSDVTFASQAKPRSGVGTIKQLTFTAT